MSESKEGGLYRSRLGKRMDEEALRYLSSLSEDREILLEDIEGTEAHVIMLCKQEIIQVNEARQILKVLEELKEKALRGELELKGDFEDVHEFIESQIIKRLGVKVGGKVHTGRSRNDQVALDIRLRVRRYLIEIWKEALDLAETLLSRAEEEKETIMLHYTHLQPAQVGYLSHYLLAHLDHLFRDIERLEECYHRVNKSPLGACAIAGSTLPLDRRLIAELLGFEGIIENSLDAVSSRDFALEALSISAIMMTNLSRIAEDLITWCSREFGYVELPDELASPSSVMPHKKNPCILELLRAKAGKVIGLLTSALTMIKAIPTGYDRDLQELKPIIWEALSETRDALQIMRKTIRGVTFKKERMLEVTAQSYAPAIELAEALIKYSSLSLREAHMLVGALVKNLHESGKTLRDLNLTHLTHLAQKILGKNVTLPEEVFRKIIDVKEASKLRATEGASTPAEIQRMIDARKKLLQVRRRALEEVLKNLLNSRHKFENSLAQLLRGH